MRFHTADKKFRTAIFASLLISWTIGTILSIIAFRAGRWKKKLPEDMQRELRKEKTK